MASLAKPCLHMASYTRKLIFRTDIRRDKPLISWIELGIRGAVESKFFNDGGFIMAKNQDTKKEGKKEPSKTLKEKKAAKRAKKEERKHQA